MLTTLFTRMRHPHLYRLALKVRQADLTYLNIQALVDLAIAVRKAPSAQIIEAGVALGGSAIVLAHTRGHGVPLRLYDVFGMIPPPSESDGKDVHDRYADIAQGKAEGLSGNTYYGYQDDLLDIVTANLRAFDINPDHPDIELIAGRFQDTLIVDSPVGVAHIDCDWYDSVMTCLERIAPHVVLGGRFIIDDYDAWSGAQQATDDFFRGDDRWRRERHNRVHFVRIA